MVRTLCTLFAIVAVAYVGLCVALFLFQGSLIYFPQPRAVTAPQSTLFLPVGDAELVVTVRQRPGLKAIIYFGGNAEDVSRSLASFDIAFPEHALFLLHYRGYGGSTGTPTEQANHRDAAALFEKVRAQHPDVAIVGRSLGSGVAVRLASRQPASRLILITPYDSVEDIASAEFPYVPVKWLLREKYESGKYAPDVKAPTTIIVAENDEVIPRASTDKLLARFKMGVASLKVIPETGHNTISDRREYLSAFRAGL